MHQKSDLSSTDHCGHAPGIKQINDRRVLAQWIKMQTIRRVCTFFRRPHSKMVLPVRTFAPYCRDRQSSGGGSDNPAMSPPFDCPHCGGLQRPAIRPRSSWRGSGSGLSSVPGHGHWRCHTSTILPMGTLSRTSPQAAWSRQLFFSMRKRMPPWLE